MVADAVKFELPEATAWTAAASTALSEYVYLGGRPLALIEGGAVHWIHGDHLGTPQKMTDATGALVWDRAARPFGAALSGSPFIGT